MTKFKVYYFNLPGEAEVVKYILNYKDQKFEEEFVELKDYLRMDLPDFDTLPCLEFDGHRIFRVQTICRYLGNIFDLAGKDDLENALLDAIGDQVSEAIRNVYNYFSLKYRYIPLDTLRIPMDVSLEEYRQNVNDKELPLILDPLEEELNKKEGNYFLGDRITWVDFLVLGLPHFMDFAKWKFDGERYPNMLRLINSIKSEPKVAEIIAERPIG
ncbi:hypothetical protein SNEBB_007191 [Seison nebaliae]|nr:hypothetical protein SNEBB_007191 [Seison nebaliae]